MKLRREFKGLMQCCNRVVDPPRCSRILKSSQGALRPLQAKQTGNFGHRFRMVVDPQVEQATQPRLLCEGTRHDEQCRRLSPANIATTDFRRFECSNEPCGQI